MSENEAKHVQTTLSEEDYRRLREIADDRGITLGEASRTALKEWLNIQRGPNSADRAFTVLSELQAISTEDSARTDARTESDVVEEWRGLPEDVSLGNEPPNGE